MDDEQLRHLERLRETSLRRLRVLEQQAATFGVRTPPEITLEIEDLRRTLVDLEQQLSGARIPDADTIPTPALATLAQNGSAQKRVPRARPVRLSHRGMLLVALGGLTLVGVVTTLILLRPAAPAPARSTRVGIASFDRCSQQSDALQSALALEFSEVEFKRLDVIRDAGSAPAQPDLDMRIWGQCDQGASQLTLSLQILVPPGPPEVSEIGLMTVQTSARDLDYATRLSRALVSYISGDYGAAANSLGTLQQQTGNPSEQASLAFLHANTLLFTERYTDTLAAYEGALAGGPLRFQALINRGFTGINLALQLGRAHKPYATVLNAALGDLSFASEAPDKQVAALALINRGTANYWVGQDYQSALADCDAALDQSGADPLGYVCRAAARYGMLDDAFCKPPPDTKLARDDLSRAKELAESQGRPAALADIYFFRAQLAQLQVACDTSDADKRVHQQEATSYFQQFLAEDGKARVHLTIDHVMVDLTPSASPLTQQP